MEQRIVKVGTCRIAEIEAEAARLHSPSDAVLVGKLETVYRRAIIDHQFHAAARAVDLQAKLHERARSNRASASLQADIEPADRPGTRLTGDGREPVRNTAAIAGGCPAQNDDFCFQEKAN